MPYEDFSMQPLPTFDAGATAKLLDFAKLVDALGIASRELAEGALRAPVRTSVPLAGGGILLSMPASADDIAIHKLVSVAPGNAARQLPTIFGTVTVCDGETGQPECILDGPTLTGCRTAALSMLGVKTLFDGTPSAFLIIGTGQQAKFHARAIAALYPAARCFVQGSSAERERQFRAELAHEGIAIEAGPHTATGLPSDIDVVITTTTSKTPVYAQAARPDRLIVAVGAFTPDAAEIAPRTVSDSVVFVDDFHAAREEAGDLLQAGVDWTAVRPLSAVLDGGVPRNTPRLLKTVGSGAWDLAACRVARQALRAAGTRTV